MLLFYKTTFKFCSFWLCLQAKFLKSYFTLIFVTATPFASWKNTMLIHIAPYCKTTSLICLLELYLWLKNFEKHDRRTRKVTSQAWQGSLFVITQKRSKSKLLITKANENLE